jgi:pimeloyl-ACP methyl ester carboxylesterase
MWDLSGSGGVDRPDVVDDDAADVPARRRARRPQSERAAGSAGARGGRRLADAAGVHGSNDLQPAASSRLYAEAFPNAQFKVIQGASHFPQIDRPDEFAKVVGEFLQAHGL